MPADGRFLSGPLSASIRVPLEWLQTTTYSLYQDEEPYMIRRVFSHPAKSASRQTFCGYCGTPLTYWCEQPRTEANYVRIALGSLFGEDLHDLEKMGIVPTAYETETVGHDNLQVPGGGGHTVNWLEKLLDGSALGRIRRRAGPQTTRFRVEWEIYEYDSDESGSDHTLDSAESILIAAVDDIEDPTGEDQMELDSQKAAKRKRDVEDSGLEAAKAEM